MTGEHVTSRRRVPPFPSLLPLRCFGQLADMFQVQKVRKTCNEMYLVAAGLPDPTLLPTAQHRACGIAGFAFDTASPAWLPRPP